MNPYTTFELPVSVPLFTAKMAAAVGRPLTEEEREAVEAMVEMVNGAYIDGLEGVPGYPEDPREEVEAYMADTGQELSAKFRAAISELIAYRNWAYAQGLQDAGKAVPV